MPSLNHEYITETVVDRITYQTQEWITFNMDLWCGSVCSSAKLILPIYHSHRFFFLRLSHFRPLIIGKPVVLG